MKVALINKEFDAARGGGEVYAINLATGLVERGHEVTLVSRVADLPGVERFEFIQVEPAPSRRSERVMSFNRAVEAALDRSRFDIVHGLTQVFPQDIHRNGGGVFRHWEILSQPNPFMRALVRLGSRNRIQRQIEDRIYARGNYRWIQTNSRLVKDHVLLYYDVPEDRIEVIHNGVDLQRFHPDNRERGMALRGELGIAPDAPVVLFVGNNIRRKGLAYLGQAMARVPGAEGVHLLVVGRARESRVRRILRAHPGRWSWVGAQADVAPYYAAADLFVLPTLYDPFANVSLEALASGVPVVTTGTNGACELLVDPECGGVVERPDEVPGLARHIDRLLAGRGEAQRQRARGVASQYPWARNIDAVVQLYEKVLADKQREGP